MGGVLELDVPNGHVIDLHLQIERKEGIRCAAGVSAGQAGLDIVPEVGDAVNACAVSEALSPRSMWSTKSVGTATEPVTVAVFAASVVPDRSNRAVIGCCREASIIGTATSMVTVVDCPGATVTAGGAGGATQPSGTSIASCRPAARL